MHAAIEADTEDGNAALAGRAAGRQRGRRATVLLRHANPTDVHHDICSHTAFPQRSRPAFRIPRCGPARCPAAPSIRIVLNYVKNRHARLASSPIPRASCGSAPFRRPHPVCRTAQHDEKTIFCGRETDVANCMIVEFEWYTPPTAARAPAEPVQCSSEDISHFGTPEVGRRATAI